MIRYLIFLISISAFLLNTQPVLCQSTKKIDILYGVFDGRTPCQELAQQLHEQTTVECIKIKWRLILYKDSVTGEPSTYNLQGFVFKRDNPQKGNWHIIKGTKTNPLATVYEITIPGKEPLLRQKGDDNILFFLSHEKELMVGNKDFSYTLNRVEKKL